MSGEDFNKTPLNEYTIYFMFSQKETISTKKIFTGSKKIEYVLALSRMTQQNTESRNPRL